MLTRLDMPKASILLSLNRLWQRRLTWTSWRGQIFTRKILKSKGNNSSVHQKWGSIKIPVFCWKKAIMIMITLSWILRSLRKTTLLLRVQIRTVGLTIRLQNPSGFLRTSHQSSWEIFLKIWLDGCKLMSAVVNKRRCIEAYQVCLLEKKVWQISLKKLFR
jgi:hypothetical protein